MGQIRQDIRGCSRKRDEKIVLITVFGADGFLGRALVTKLAGTPSITINAFSHFSTLLRDESAYHPFKKLKNVTIVPGDFHNQVEVEEAVKGSDYVFHLVTSTTPASSANDPFVDMDTNVRSTIQLQEICAAHKVRRLVFFSSGGAVYGNVDNDNIQETDCLYPISPYGIGKVTIEHYFEYFHQTRNLNYLIYRVANPYGPGQRVDGKQGVIPIFMHKLLENKPITVFGDGQMVRDYIYIDDFVNMVCATFDKKTRHNVYNIGSGNGITVNELVRTIESNHHTKFKKVFADLSPAIVQRNVLNIDRFVKEFNITPKIDLKEGMERTWEYVREIS
jgi:UDP-glucose 4-epimerase